MLFKLIAQHFILPGDTRQTTSKVSMPDAGDHFFAPNNNVGDAKYFTFFTFTAYMGFLIVNPFS